ncbi:hypothetical protein MESS4_750214 [Mesorhizobium sp. STM 4661]|nr:hypothetical protein MESS4_750214 [Mesorhizobium sp. STM 4661]
MAHRSRHCSARGNGIVIGDLAAIDHGEFELSCLDELGQQGGIVQDLKCRAEMPIVVLQRIKAMRIGGHDAVEGAFRDRIDVGLRECLEQALFPGAPHIVAAVALGIEENAEIDTDGGQQFGHLAGDFLNARIVGGVVADEPQHFDGFAACVLDRKAELPGPARPHLGRLAHGVAETGQVRQRILEAGADAPFVNQMAAHVDDLRQVLDLDRAPSMQARQVVQAHSVASEMTPPTSGSADGPAASASRMSVISILGLSGRPAA